MRNDWAAQGTTVHLRNQHHKPIHLEMHLHLRVMSDDDSCIQASRITTS